MAKQATDTTVTRPDTHDMVIVHRVFRREFRLLPDLVRAVADGDTTRAALVGRHADELVTALHHHHTGEDQLLWPRLRERTAVNVELVATMERQHEHVAVLLATAHDVIPAWSAAADASTRDKLAAILGEVSTALDEHLTQEEREILPLAEQHMTADEWAELGKRGMAAIPKDRLFVFLGHMLEETTPGERMHMLRNLPVPARVLYQVVGKRQYKRETAAVRADITLPRQRQP